MQDLEQVTAPVAQSAAEEEEGKVTLVYKMYQLLVVETGVGVVGQTDGSEAIEAVADDDAADDKDGFGDADVDGKKHVAAVEVVAVVNTCHDFVLSAQKIWLHQKQLYLVYLRLHQLSYMQQVAEELYHFSLSKD